VHGSSGDHQRAVFKIKVGPLQGKNLAHPEAKTHRNHHHGPKRLTELLADLLELRGRDNCFLRRGRLEPPLISTRLRGILCAGINSQSIASSIILWNTALIFCRVLRERSICLSHSCTARGVMSVSWTVPHVGRKCSLITESYPVVVLLQSLVNNFAGTVRLDFFKALVNDELVENSSESW
jgi:hypothetical protein